MDWKAVAESLNAYAKESAETAKAYYSPHAFQSGFSEVRQHYELLAGIAYMLSAAIENGLRIHIREGDSPKG